jgi:hypothetical protein
MGDYDGVLSINLYHRVSEQLAVRIHDRLNFSTNVSFVGNALSILPAHHSGLFCVTKISNALWQTTKQLIQAGQHFQIR